MDDKVDGASVKAADAPEGPSLHTDPAPEKTLQNVVDYARAATAKEQNMSLLEGIRLYPKAIMFSVIISTCIVMEGYDICLINNFYAFSQFKRKYGVPTADGGYEVTAPWQAGLSNVRSPHPTPGV